MPTTYAHYRFGSEVAHKVNPQAKEAIESFPEVFGFGVHGPDLLFYYNPLSKNKVNTLGERLHELPGTYFFENAAKTLRRLEEVQDGEQDIREYYSYVYGFLCHFALDVCCHGYIQEKIDASGITHSEIEAELDRELLVMDGKDPVSQKLTGHLMPSMEKVKVIREFFPNIDSQQIYKTMKDMVMYLNILVLPGKAKRNAVLTALKLAGHYEGMHGLIINYEKNPTCEDSTEMLIKLYHQAIDLAVELIDSFGEVVRGERNLQDVYHYNFSSENPETGKCYPVM